MTAGGGGYGPPAGREPEAIRAEIRDGLLSESRARELYPKAVHALP